MKKIIDLDTISTDASNFYFGKNTKQTKLFDKVFLADKFYTELLDKNKYFIVGEKGTGKTSYAAYYCLKHADRISNIINIDSNIYSRFIKMKRKSELENSDYSKIWKNILYYLLVGEILSYYSQQNYFRRLVNRSSIKKLRNFSDSFYKKAYVPDSIEAFDITTEYKISTNSELDNTYKKGKWIGTFRIGRNSQKNISESAKQFSSLTPTDHLISESEAILKNLEFKDDLTLFFDGLDVLPENVAFENYLECITGLINAIIEINRNREFSDLNLRLCLLIRPDLIGQMTIHNLGRLLEDNSMILNWNTTDDRYRNSLLFKIADNFLSKQQDEEIEFGKSWDYYFPFKNKQKEKQKKKNRKFGNNSDSFTKILRYSQYRPRDIITILNYLIERKKENLDDRSTEVFRFEDVNHIDFKRRYQEYLKTELKDYMAVYMTQKDFEVFNNFLLSFNRLGLGRTFNFGQFEDVFNNYFSDIAMPVVFNSSEKMLNLLYDSGLICYIEDSNMMWAFKSRSYSNLTPQIPLDSEYVFEENYANAYNLKFEGKK